MNTNRFVQPARRKCIAARRAAWNIIFQTICAAKNHHLGIQLADWLDINRTLYEYNITRPTTVHDQLLALGVSGKDSRRIEASKLKLPKSCRATCAICKQHSIQLGTTMEIIPEGTQQHARPC
jgi:hypothetical protein